MRARIVAVLIASLIVSAEVVAQATNPPREAVQSRGQARSAGEGQVVCRGATIPQGWILVDDMRSSELCGGTNPVAFNLYNVWAIERYDNRPVGTTMEVCAAAQTPPGWVVDDIYRSKERCGHPDEPFVVNVKRIRRVR